MIMGETFGQRLHYFRRTGHLTQAALGGSELPAREVSLLERGRREPSPGAVRLLAERLAVAGLPRAYFELSAAQAWDERDYSAARGFALRASAAALAAGDETGEWELSYLAAVCLRRQHAYRQCIAEAERLAQHPLAGEGQPLRPLAETLLATACQGAGRLADAVVHARRALDLGFSLQVGPEYLVEAYQAFIAALSESGLQDEAWGHCLTLLVPLLESGSGRQTAGKGFWAVGNVAFRRGDVANGLRYHTRAASLLSPTADLEVWAAFNRASAAMRLAEGVHDDATRECLAQAETALSVVGGTEEDGLDNLHNQGRWLQLSGNHPSAVDVLSTVYGRRGVLPPQSTGEVALHLGLSLAALGRRRQAVQALEDSAAAFARAGAPDRAGHAARLSAQVQSGSPVGLTERTGPW